MEQLQIIGDFINKVGFPAFVALWFIFRADKRISKMSERMLLLLAAQRIVNDSDEHEAIPLIPETVAEDMEFTGPMPQGSTPPTGPQTRGRRT